MRRSLCGLIALGLVWGGAEVAGAGGGLAADPVITGRARQYMPTADLDWIAWTQQFRNRQKYDVFAQHHDGTGRVQVDTRRPLWGFAGDFDPIDGRLLFQEGSNLRYWDPDTEGFGPPPAGINTRRHEWGPRTSSGYILFGRNRFERARSPWRVILYDRTLQTFRTLATVTNRCGCISPEAVTDQYAAWSTCQRRCHVWVYDIAGQTTSRIPNPPGLHQYAAALTPGGEAYFVRGASACGDDIGLYRWQIGDGAGDTIVLVHAFDPGVDLWWRMSVLVDGGGHEDVYFDRFECSVGRPDVYVVQDADTVVLPPATSDADRDVLGAAERTPIGAIPAGSAEASRD